MADGVIGGQRVVPARLRELGFDFSHPEIGPALTALLAES
jgi:NAD dependent epimerase/dehydratase family enzyme